MQDSTSKLTSFDPVAMCIFQVWQPISNLLKTSDTHICFVMTPISLLLALSYLTNWIAFQCYPFPPHLNNLSSVTDFHTHRTILRGPVSATISSVTEAKRIKCTFLWSSSVVSQSRGWPCPLLERKKRIKLVL